MKKVGIIIFLGANLYMLWYYVNDIIKYYNGTYNYDGMRYLIPITISDILFLISLVVLYFSFGFSKYLFGFLAIAFMHNIAMGVGIERIPFVGLIAVIISIIFAFKMFNK